MIKTTGLKENYKPFEKIGKDVYMVRWDYTEVEESDSAIWMEEMVYSAPEEAWLRNLFNKYYNEQTEQKIRSGYMFGEIPVWLSEENQHNYKAAYDIAVQKSGSNLPITFKLGTDEQPVYQTFDTVRQLESFYLPAVAYVQQCLEEGWKKKDSIDYSLYVI